MVDYNIVVKKLKMSELITAYNRFGTSPIRHFTDRKIAEERTAKLLTENEIDFEKFRTNGAFLCDATMKKLEKIKA